MSPFSLGTLVVPPGGRVDGWFDLAALPTGHVERLPVAIIHGKAPGPVLWATANIHGDEVTGLHVVHELLDDDLSELRGTLVAIPTLNPAGLRTGRRESYLDRRDPNRLFPDFPADPGAPRPAPGLLEAAYERLFVEIRRADLLVDLHCYGPRASCFTIRDRILYSRDDERDEALALCERVDALCDWLGLPTVRDAPPERYLEARLHRSLSGAALLQARIPAVTVELGLTGAVDPAARAAGVAALRNVLRGAGMLPGPRLAIPGIPLPSPSFPVRLDLVPRARRSGVIRYHVEPGDLVRVGDRLATLSDIHGRQLEGGEILAEHEGWIIALPRPALCLAGEAVVHMAVADELPLVARRPGPREV